MIVEIVRDAPWIVKAIGDIDLSNVGEFRKALDEAIKEFPEGFVIDLSEAQYIDSAGVMAIIYAFQCVHPNGGKLALVIVKPTVKEILAVVHLEKLPGIAVFKDLASAKNLFSPMLRFA